MKNLVLLFILLISVTFLSCKNIMSDTIYDKEYEEGRYNQTEFNRACFAEE